METLLACLLGGALGDGLGAAAEGSGGRQLVLPERLYVTDDTQLTLATCEAVIQAGQVELAAVANRFAEMFRRREIDGIGASTWKALSELAAGGHWAMCGATGERAAGNGAAMRVAPLAFVLNCDDEKHRQQIRDICRITHRNDEAYLGALAVIRSVAYGLKHQHLRGLLPRLMAALPDCRVRDRLLAIHEYAESSDAPMSLGDYAARFGSGGYVVDAVPMAILAAMGSASFLETTRQIIHCGGDTDTIASIYGQIYGATHGLEMLPVDLADRLDVYAELQRVAKDFARWIDRL